MPNLYQDQYAKLRVTRQKRYQLRRFDEGRCIFCGKEAAAGTVRCEGHRLSHNARKRVKHADICVS